MVRSLQKRSKMLQKWSENQWIMMVASLQKGSENHPKMIQKGSKSDPRIEGYEPQVPPRNHKIHQNHSFFIWRLTIWPQKSGTRRPKTQKIASWHDAARLKKMDFAVKF